MSYSLTQILIIVISFNQLYDITFTKTDNFNTVLCYIFTGKTLLLGMREHCFVRTESKTLAFS